MFFLKSKKNKKKEKEQVLTQLVNDDDEPDASSFLAVEEEDAKDEPTTTDSRQQRQTPPIVPSAPSDPQRVAAVAPAPAPATATAKDDFSSDLEKAIVLSLLEATKPAESVSAKEFGTDNKKTFSLASSSSEKISTSAMTNSNSNSHSHNSKGSGEDITDPAVLAFMERRKQRLQQQKEENLAKQMLKEAARLKLSAADVIADQMKSTSRDDSPQCARGAVPSLRVSSSILRSMSQDLNQAQQGSLPLPPRDRTISVDSHSHSRTQSFDMQDEPLNPPQQSSPAMSTLTYSTSNEIDGERFYRGAPSVSQDAPSLDPSHIFHRDNAVALQMINGLANIAKQRVQHLPQYQGVSTDAAVMQLMSLWMSQASLTALAADRSRSESNTPRIPPSPASLSGKLPPPRPMLFSHPSSPSPAAVVGSKETFPKAATPASNISNVNAQWSCKLCTLLNPRSSTKCDACGSPSTL